MHAVIGKKLEQTQKFLTNGTRIPVTVVATPGNPVVAIKTKDKDGYNAVQLGFGTRKNAGKSQLGHAKKAELTKAPFLLKEVRFSDKQAESLPAVGEMITAQMVVAPGDIVDAHGISKGKGFAGGVKRYGFHGGPKTHGQSDRWRAPGSLGSGTTPGRVYKGKRMAGKMGNDTVTIKNLEVVAVGDGYIWVKGVVPGSLGQPVVIVSTGKKNKKFVDVAGTQEVVAKETDELGSEDQQPQQPETPKEEAPKEEAK